MQMALMEIKFCHFWIVLSAIFILLSVLTTAEQQVEGHRCYWCGPLAEQVHRSQRASSCDGDIKDKVTVCDEGLPYCAIVATSPPYVESRFCVKVYQDECYTVYCNTTKTWKITCPCRGELCNSNNTKRESEAFQSLLKNNIAKLSQNQRFKRNFAKNKGFINTRRTEEVAQNNTTTIEEEKPVTEIYNSITEDITIADRDISNNNLDNIEIDTMSGNIISREGDSSDSSEEEAYNDSSDTESETESMSSESIENTSVKPKEDRTKIAKNATIDPTIQISIPKSSLESEDLKTDIIVMSSESPKSSTTPAAVTHKLTPMATETQINTAKATPEMTPGSHISLTTQITTPAGNTATRVDAHILTVVIVIGAILHYRIN